MTRVRALVAVIVLVIGACASGGRTSPTTRSIDLTVFAAASLRGAMEAARAAYGAANPGVVLIISSDSSSALATQIEQGAPADVFLSADTTNPERLVDGGFADGQPTAFAANALTMIVPGPNPAGIATPADLARPGVKVIAAGGDVPITKYATLLVDRLAAQSGYPVDFATAYAANVVSREDNVKAVVAKIELGEGDAAIVYVTDAAASTKVATIELPAAANVTASYAGIVVRASTQRDAARSLLDWLRGPEGQAVLASFGFQPPS